MPFFFIPQTAARVYRVRPTRAFPILLPLSALLAMPIGCATSSDPHDGGFVSGVVGIAGGGYERRIDEREQSYRGELDAQARLKAEAQALEQEQAAVPSDADTGYYSGTELAAAEAAGATFHVPIPGKHKALNGQGRITGERFHYNNAVDAYVCPAGELLQPAGQPQEKNGVLRTRYTRPARRCQGCRLQAVCLATPDSARSVYRSQHAELVAAHRRRFAEHGSERMRQRSPLANRMMCARRARPCGMLGASTND
jgi:hypothetical protein